MLAPPSLDRLVAQGALPAIIVSLHLSKQKQPLLELGNSVVGEARRLRPPFELCVQVLTRRAVQQGDAGVVVEREIALLDALPDTHETGSSYGVEADDDTVGRGGEAQGRATPEIVGPRG